MWVKGSEKFARDLMWRSVGDVVVVEESVVVEEEEEEEEISRVSSVGSGGGRVEDAIVVVVVRRSGSCTPSPLAGAEAGNGKLSLVLAVVVVGRPSGEAGMEVGGVGKVRSGG